MNPLLEHHRHAGAETQFYDEIEIVSTFGIPQAEYAAIRKSVGMIDLPQRGVLEITGRDRHAFLNNLLTNQTYDKQTKTPLAAGTCTYAFLLNLKGRVALDVNLIELGDRTLLEMDTRLVDTFARLLDRYLFADQVKLAPLAGKIHEIALHGPGASGILLAEGLASAAELANGACRQASLLGVEIVIWRSDVCGVPGLHLLVPNDKSQMLWDHLLERHGAEIELGKRSLRPVGWAAFNAVRIEAGTPLFGIDFELAEPAVPGAKPRTEEEVAAPRAAGVLPAETGLLTKAVSFTKGCYLGQEVVARMHARQQVARKLVGLKVADGALPIAGEHVYDEQNNQIGAITSSTMSPMLSDTAIAMAIVRKPHFEIGRTVVVPAEGAMRKAEVVALPFVQE